MQAYIALGTNLGDRLANLNAAVHALSLLPGTTITALSGVYQTAPVGYDDQPDFYNACLRCETTLSPRTLLGACLGIEAAMGRKRQIPNGPRIIDLDLLLYEQEHLQCPELTLPHPRMMERAFVLGPLCEITDNPACHHALSQLSLDGICRLTDTLTLPL